MCNRKRLKRPPEDLAEIFGLDGPLPNFDARYNIAPTDSHPVVRFNPETRRRSLDMLRWGLVPLWAKDISVGVRATNARSETLRDKPTFSDAFQRRRCLIPADGWYEWRSEGKAKHPFTIARRDRDLIVFAGLWDRWKDPASGEITRSYSIVTTEAGPDVDHIHDRQPVLLDRGVWGAWLGEEEGNVDRLLRPSPAGVLEAWPVDARIGNVRVEDASLADPVAAPPPTAQQAAMLF